MEVFKNQEDCPNYLVLKDHSIVNKPKMPGTNILQTVFEEESYCDPWQWGYSLYNGPIRGRGLSPKGLLLQVYEKVQGFH